MPVLFVPRDPGSRVGSGKVRVHGPWSRVWVLIPSRHPQVWTERRPESLEIGKGAEEGKSARPLGTSSRCQAES